MRKTDTHEELKKLPDKILHCLARRFQDGESGESVSCLYCMYAFECYKEYKESGNVLFLDLMKELERCTSVDIFLHRNKSLSILKGSWAEKYPDVHNMLTNKSFEEQLDSLMSPDILQYLDNQCCK